MQKHAPSIGILVLVAVCSTLIGMLIATSINLTPQGEALPFWREGRQNSNYHTLMPSLKMLSKTASPTVVNIRTTKKMNSGETYRRFETPEGDRKSVV